MNSQHLFLLGAGLMLLDAVGYSFGAVRQLHRRSRPESLIGVGASS